MIAAPRGRVLVGSVISLIVAFGVPVLVILFGIRGVHQAQQIARRGVPATATVTGVVTSRPLGTGEFCRGVDVSYTTTAGTPERASAAADGCLPIGSSVEVVYDPQAPDVAALRTRADPGISDANGQIITGVVLLLLDLWAVGYVMWRRRHSAAPNGVWQEVKTRRTPHGIAIAAALAVVTELLSAYFVFGAGSSDVAGVAVIVIAVAAVIYLGTPRSFSIRRGRGGGRNLVGVGWVLALVLTLTLPRTLTDSTAKAIGQPHRAVVTQVEVNRSRSGGVSRNYALLVDDGERLPLGTVNDSDVGTLDVGDTTTVYVDPHHLVKTEVTTNLGREASLALLALIGLVGLNVGAVLRRRRGHVSIRT